MINVKASIRLEMIESNIKRELQGALNKLEIRFASITGVQVSAGCDIAKVYCTGSTPESIYASDEELHALDLESAHRLNKNKANIIKLIIKKVSGRRMPKITFLPDVDLRRQIRVQKIIESLDIQ